MRLVKFLEHETLRIRKKILLIGFRDGCLVAWYEEWRAEVYAIPRYWTDFVCPAWNKVGKIEGVTTVDAECHETLGEIEKEYGRVIYSGKFINLPVVRVGDVEMSGRSIKMALKKLLVKLSEKAWSKPDEN